MCIADWNKNEIKELRLKYKIIEKYLLTEGIKDDENEIKETVEKIRKILNKLNIVIKENDIIRIINFGFTKHVLGIKFMNIRDQDCEPLSQLMEIIQDIKKRNNKCKVCGKKGHYYIEEYSDNRSEENMNKHM
ncbi:hypothetical protein RhiirA5_477431 [Rhizophagus irregularis]|uniref:Uncharacterized protein n=1 Tax=Rhizophagus irregularis TaxID=588596 RepID=A0A2I1EK13_9GLOM|nr:hypothetical protein RhiirA5_477431 [Rhizophagus irregularis]GBC43377.1 hypothetical protein RIR_jg5297.t1 [Rhizophagus irregularis DAOM 181602=DAOM 197198]PKC65040.1 hypothetical protein RhiirA1_515457 [Rhizophagus irregularis]PKY22461.1 hypothetical protein RhiirB3_503284 [Rhizophagus irregularis]UZO07929.1 hypothetical protein OCT59_028199 [Rhizophagus irregularis]